ncbi:MAG: S41 family peptidase [Oleiphilaceae bacterium]|nr:S41 family peptidase [Oleiphilaceae bacterium]
MGNTGTDHDETELAGEQIPDPDAGHFSSLTGIWRSRGYGKLLEIDESGYTLYEETRISCLPVYGGPLSELAERYVDLVVSPAGNAFSARRATGVTRVGFRRLQALPDTCEELSDEQAEDPLFNFDVLCANFTEQYGLFPIKNLDWPAQCRRYRARITGETDPEALFALMTALIRPLRDGHVRLHAPFAQSSAGAHPALYRRLERELEEADDHRDVLTYLAELREWLREVIHEDYLEGASHQGGSRLLEWGAIRGQAGYLNIRAMAGQSGAIGHPAEDMAAVDELMPRVLQQLGHLPALIVDLRGNGGGYDGVALRLASYLTDRRRLAFSKAARFGAGYTGRQKITLRPAQTAPYGGQIYLLTSELTASAAEIFVLSLLQHPRLTLVGEPTQGILSDTLERHLPNGWFFTLSNELYHSYDGAVYEDVGIPPHIRLPFLARRGRQTGRDPMLERVLYRLIPSGN